MLPVWCLVLALVAAACGQAAAAHSSSRRYTVGVRTAPVRQVRVAGGSAAQRELLRRIVSTAGITQIRALRITPASASWHPVRPGDVELLAVLRGPSGPKHENLRGEWEAWVIGGAFRDLSAARGLPRVLAVGSVGAGESRVSPPTTHLPSQPISGASAFRRRAIGALRAAGAHVVSVRVGVPDGYTVAAAVETSTPATFLQHRLQGLLERLADLKSDGWLLAVYGPDGTPIDIAVSGARISVGGGRVGPRYQSCVSGLDMGGPAGIAPPPPCPADARPPADTPPKPLAVRGWDAAGKAAVGAWNGPQGIAVPYAPGATGALGFALQNENGSTATVEAIHVDAGTGGSVVRYVGARIEVPPSRTRPGAAGELQRPFGPVAPFAPLRIRPGDWVGVALHFQVGACTVATAGRELVTDRTLTVTYELAGATLRHTYASVPLHVATPTDCASASG